MTQVYCHQCVIPICVICFCNGRETKKHKKTHKYTVFDKLDFNIFQDGWTAFDEISLIEGLQMYGYGNWLDISKNITGKEFKEA